MQQFIVQTMAVKVVFLLDFEISCAQELAVEIIHSFVDVVRHISLFANLFLWCWLIRAVLPWPISHRVDRGFVPELCRFPHLRIDLARMLKAGRRRQLHSAYA